MEVIHAHGHVTWSGLSLCIVASGHGLVAGVVSFDFAHARLHNYVAVFTLTGGGFRARVQLRMTHLHLRLIDLLHAMVLVGITLAHALLLLALLLILVALVQFVLVNTGHALVLSILATGHRTMSTHG